MRDCGKLLPEIYRLVDLYEYRWGKPVCILIRPPGGQPVTLEVLKRIVNTGESLIVGYSSCSQQVS